MTHVVAKYIDAKYGSGGPGSSRFDPDPDEVHASHVRDCQRKRYWKHSRGHRSDPSVYFELGRIHELLYGAALAFEHDPNIGARELRRLKPWEVVERSDRVIQDVNVSIDVPGGGEIVGECDWVVADAPIDHVEDVQDHEPRIVLADGTEADESIDMLVERVIETKTKNDLSGVRRYGPDEAHVYQVYPYMHALDVDGEIAYLCRDDWDEHVADVEYDPTRWLDVIARARTHMSNYVSDDVPPATPRDEGECRFCPFREECAELGGSPWA